ncbi:hypothetical protein F4778DRAFT_800849 [Xylariomycetidae sp. FL2044]|nr:hypothetical protein F4778DRAFT_800849 [Xylariomycetidae sp. FL2044]
MESECNNSDKGRGNGIIAPEAGNRHSPSTGVTRSLDALCAQDSLEVLEAGVQASIPILEKLENLLSGFGCLTWNFLTNVQKLRWRSTQPIRTVICVIGNPGAGTSSIINALLDEDNLLPTNCVRASSTVPIEFHYDRSDSKIHRAEIHFITSDELIREVRALRLQIQPGAPQDSIAAKNAAVTLVKLFAVYPCMSENILRTADEDFLAHPSVQPLLNTMSTFERGSAIELYRELQPYVEYRRSYPSMMEYWPLIKSVQIFSKADVLSTGAVIIDMPYIPTSNIARPSFANADMQSCSRLFIVSPVQRAAHDVTAELLLQYSIARQVQPDSVCSIPTFILSKTDDISVSEAMENFGLKDKIQKHSDNATDLTAKGESLRSRMESLIAEKNANKEKMEILTNEGDQPINLQSDLPDGKRGRSSARASGKRKRTSKLSTSRKGLSRDSSSSGGDGGHDSGKSVQRAVESPRLDDESVCEKLAALKFQPNNTYDKERKLDDEVRKVREQLEITNSELRKISEMIRNICIKIRNEYSGHEIRTKYALNSKGMNAPGTLDHEKEANRLTIYAVSSHAYQKLSGRLENDGFDSQGFLSVADTGIPQLQKYTKDLPSSDRRTHHKRLLRDAAKVFGELDLWAEEYTSKFQLSDKERETEAEHLQKLLDGLKKDLHESVDALRASLRQELDQHLYRRFDELVAWASSAALGTVISWGAHLEFSTYRAAAKNQGEYDGDKYRNPGTGTGQIDFNRDLLRPIMDNVEGPWNRTFTQEFPRILDEFPKRVNDILDAFHVAAISRASNVSTNPESLARALTLRLNGYKYHVDHLLPDGRYDELKRTVAHHQTVAHERFTPAIKNVMRPVYNQLAADSGKYVFYRMKRRMKDYVRNELDNQPSLFDKVMNDVRGHIDQLLVKSVGMMIAQVDALCHDVDKIYMSTLVLPVEDVPAQDRQMRQRLHEFLIQADHAFSPIVDNLDPSEAQETPTDASNENDQQSGDNADMKQEEYELEQDEIDKLVAGVLRHLCSRIIQRPVFQG